MRRGCGPFAKLERKSLVATLVLMVAGVAPAQDSEFAFDPNGNLHTQTAAILAPPQILSQPQTQVVQPGELASFFVVATDTRGLGYQWRFNGTNILGAISDTLLLTNVSATNEGQYSVVLSNSFDTVTSASADLWIDSDGDGLPDSWELAYFGNLNQTATGDFDGDGVSNLQEFQDGTNPTNSASALYRLTVLSDGGAVTVIPSLLSYTNGQSVTLTATPFPPEAFHAWTGDALTHSNVVTLTMTNNKTLFAHFSPMNFEWTNSAGGDWNVVANWLPNLVPGTNDNVFITDGATVTLNSTNECADLTLGNSSSAPILSGSGTLTIHGTCTWTAGSMTGGGRTVIDSGAELDIVNPGTIFIDNHTLENGGTVLWTGAGSWSFVGGVITNRPGAVFEVQSAASLYLASGSPSRFDNAGTFRKSVSPGTFNISTSISFNNYGEVDLQTGTLTLAGGGNDSGTMDVADGATLNLSLSTFTSTSGSSITGAGNLTVSGATANLAGLVNLGGTNTFSNGTANLTGDYICTNNTVVISGGNANFSGTGTVAPLVINLNGNSGVLGGSDLVTVENVMNWTAGTMSGTGTTLIPPGATLNIANAGGISSTTRTLENGGTVLWTGAGNWTVTSAVITNRTGALFEVQSPTDFYWYAGNPSRIDNAGTFRKSVSTGTLTVSGGISFNNYGEVDVQTGTLHLTGGNNSGQMDVAVGTTLNLAGGTFSSTSGSSISGAGNLTVSGATANLAGLVNLSGTNNFSNGTANLTGDYICTNNTVVISGGDANFSGTGTVAPLIINLDGNSGVLGGSDLVTVENVMNWTAGTMSGTGTTVIPPGVTLNIANASGISSTTRTLENGGTVLWTGAGNWTVTSAVITNRAGALFEVQTPTDFYWYAGNPSRIDNAGTFRKSVSTGTLTVSGGISFKNYGTVEIQAGILSANGGYSSGSNAVLDCTLGGTTAGTGYGQLRVSGTTTLNGALDVGLSNGFLPALNDTFTVLTAGTRSGSFASFYYPSNFVTMELSNTPNSVIVGVSGVISVPQPVLAPPELFPPNVKLTWTSVSNLTYRVEYNPTLAPSNWVALPGGDVTGVSNTASKLDPLTSSNRFYRVMVVVP